MANKAYEHLDEIMRLKADGESVRSIAAKLSLPASSVQYVLKQGNGNGESKEAVQVDQSVWLRRIDSLELLVQELQARVVELENTTALVWKPYGKTAYVLGGMMQSSSGKAYPVVFKNRFQLYWRDLMEWINKSKRREK